MDDMEEREVFGETPLSVNEFTIEGHRCTTAEEFFEINLKQKRLTYQLFDSKRFIQYCFLNQIIL